MLAKGMMQDFPSARLRPRVGAFSLGGANGARLNDMKKRQCTRRRALSLLSIFGCEKGVRLTSECYGW
jgi:hypothetical protein